MGSKVTSLLQKLGPAFCIIEGGNRLPRTRDTHTQDAPAILSEQQAPPAEHPKVPGLFLQEDGWYWNPAWDEH